jgi:prepilin-type N-terminal cleavage/methylation domain-containing protein
MKRAMGFTLVELLVVIAIISILASIAVPNITQYLERARMTKAEAEINSIETALTAILADSGRRDFSGTSFFSNFPNTANIEAATEIYTEAFYLIMKAGNDAGGPGLEFPTGVAIHDDIRRSLGSTYMDELGNDPWGQRYLIFPGPWRSAMGDIEFRKVARDEDAIGEPDDDSIVLYRDPETDAQIETGYPAPKTKPYYVYSRGANLVSNQLSSAGYQAVVTGGPDTVSEPDFVGGGDDISNWDNTRSYAQFYR